MTGTLPAPDENGRLPLSSLGSTTMTTSTQPLTLNNLMWQGDINGLLDLMAAGVVCTGAWIMVGLYSI